jgi:hypothetical protein
MYEREDFPLPFLALFSTPFIQMTEAVVEPRGENLIPTLPSSRAGL